MTHRRQLDPEIGQGDLDEKTPSWTVQGPGSQATGMSICDGQRESRPCACAEQQKLSRQTDSLAASKHGEKATIRAGQSKNIVSALLCGIPDPSRGYLVAFLFSGAAAIDWLVGLIRCVHLRRHTAYDKGVPVQFSLPPLFRAPAEGIVARVSSPLTRIRTQLICTYYEAVPSLPKSASIANIIYFDHPVSTLVPTDNHIPLVRMESLASNSVWLRIHPLDASLDEQLCSISDGRKGTQSLGSMILLPVSRNAC
ncbi:hypothetical protein L249_8235 [Ophiocordyceps polyrhachis-furcata BCC 54312]|uniref:Uncharacterized protein n=1 Tax=Ophiocordyceps polyrhachis-furcata BCC 54312 TaxID=1330021 RepID=A0A367LHW6_9HYPO|nr:hypothetical protein L249_8235 [Ophiocordyceps polyrhachis-furcata BCC 54312]